MRATVRDWGVVPLRIVVGIVFLAHGAQKLFVFGLAGTTGFMEQLGLPLPGLAAMVVIAVELVGGFALLLGLFTRWIAALLAVDMLVAALTAHAKGGFFLPEGMEFVLTLFGASVSLALLGPGPLSVDRALARGRR